MSLRSRTAAASTLERHSDDEGKKGTAREQQCRFNHSHRSLPATKPLQAQLSRSTGIHQHISSREEDNQALAYRLRYFPPPTAF
jgi:hypothetical protein